MPLTRLILFLWTFGLVVLLGAWGHSLFRKAMIRYSQPREGVMISLAIVGGSIEFVRTPIRGRGKDRINLHSMELKPGSIPPPVPTYKFGRFYRNHREVNMQGAPEVLTTIEVPIWILLPPWTLLCFLPYRYYRKRQRHLSGSPDEPTAS